MSYSIPFYAAKIYQYLPGDMTETINLSIQCLPVSIMLCIVVIFYIFYTLTNEIINLHFLMQFELAYFIDPVTS